MDDALRIIVFVGVARILATIYINHPDLPKRSVDWILDDFPFRIVIFGVGGFVLVMLVNFINY